jgi:hypothetical protein
VIPEDERLSRPGMAEIARHLGGGVLWGADRLDVQVGETVVAAMGVGNFLSYVRPGCLVITPGDRADIILAVLAARLSGAFPHPAGLVLTGGLEVAPTVARLLDDWADVPLPVIGTGLPTFPTLKRLASSCRTWTPGSRPGCRPRWGFSNRGWTPDIHPGPVRPGPDRRHSGLVFEQSVHRAGQKDFTRPSCFPREARTACCAPPNRSWPGASPA